MNELYRITAKKAFSLTQGIVCAVFISVLAPALVHHRHLKQFFHHLNWTLFLFFAICIVSGFIVCLYLPSVPKNLPFFLGIFYLFCYTACAALCQKLALTQLYVAPDDQINRTLSQIPNLLVIPGLILIFLASIMQMKAAIYSSKNMDQNSYAKEILPKYPFYKSWLLFMAGVSLLFGVWLPLLALPGALIFFKWLN